VCYITVFIIHNLVFLLAIRTWKCIFRAINSRRMRWARRIARMEETRSFHRFLVGKPFGRPRRRLEDSIKLYLQEVECGVMAQDKDS